jgi:hypothetical protein
MPDYSDLLDFLAKNPPLLESERQLHASLLELMAQCLRSETVATEQAVDNADEPLEDRIAESHIRWVRFN